jgi:hypothetical protein
VDRSAVDILMLLKYSLTMRTTVRVSDDLLRKARKKAAEEGRTLTSPVEEGLRTVLAESKPNEGECVCLSPGSRVARCPGLT